MFAGDVVKLYLKISYKDYCITLYEMIELNLMNSAHTVNYSKCNLCNLRNHQTYIIQLLLIKLLWMVKDLGIIYI